MAEGNESFVFYKSFYEAIRKLPAENQLELYNAILQYSFTGEIPENLSEISSAMFILMKPNLDSSQRKYKSSVENGKKGGRPRKNNEKQPNKNPTKTQVKPSANLNDNVDVDDNVYDDVNDNVNDNVNADDDNNFSKVIDEYENNITTTTPTAIEILQSYYEDLGGELVIEAIKRASLANKRSCKYIQGILNSWLHKGYKTLVEVRNEEEEFKKRNIEKNKNTYNNYEQRDINNVDFNKFLANIPPGEER